MVYVKNYDQWNIKVKELNSENEGKFFNVRDIWWCAIGLNIGSEQDGKDEYFERPILVIKKVSNDFLWILPITSKIIQSEYRVDIYDLEIESQVVISQIRSISNKRLIRRVGMVKRSIFIKIIVKLSLIFLFIIKNETPQ